MPTYLIESERELSADELKSYRTIGITAGICIGYTGVGISIVPPDQHVLAAVRSRAHALYGQLEIDVPALVDHAGGKELGEEADQAAATDTARRDPSVAMAGFCQPIALADDKPPQSVTNSIGMKFVRLPASAFQMGSPFSEP